MSTFSLDDIRAAADAKFGHTDIKLNDDETLRLTNALQLPKAIRKELEGFQDRLDEDGADTEEILSDVIRLVATDKKLADKYLTALDGNLALIVQTFSSYNEGTQMGEASTSQA